MKCELCGYEFSEDESLEACKGCPVSNCKILCCPNCGYETLPEPKSLKLIKRWFKRDDKRSGPGST